PPARFIEGRVPQKCSHPFRRKNGRAQIRKAKNIFAGHTSGASSGGAFVERTIQFRATTRAERATSFVLKIGSNLVQ
ncbi:MAG: hypothetical protein AAB911_00750, partial [Patescibacteria group bacterium]